MSDEISYLPSVDKTFCDRLAAEVAEVEFKISESAAPDDSGAQWAVSTAYGETFRSILFDGQNREAGAFAPPEITEAASRIAGLGEGEGGGGGEVAVFRAQANVMLPGQGLGRHTDVPEFYRARRWSFPDWLLVAMLHSGLYDDDQVRIVSAVVWPTTTGGGDLRVFDRTDTHLLASFPPVPGAAVVSDTYRLPHDVWTIPGDEVEVGPGDRIGLRGDVWVLERTDGSTATLERDQVRMSVLIKVACFHNNDERDRYFDRTGEMLDQDDVIARLAEQIPATERQEGAALHQQLVDHYVSYM
jgi:hypothetical protein